MSDHTKQSRFRKGLVIFSWVLIIAAIVIAIAYYFFVSKYATTNDAQVDQYVTPVAARITGYVKEVRYQENQFVHKGDTLIVIDSQEYQNKRAGAEAELKSSEAMVAVNENTAKASAGAMKIHAARLEAAKVQVWKTEQDFKRYKNLLAERSATLHQFEQAKAAYAAAQADYKAIEQEGATAGLTTQQEYAKIKPAEVNIKEKQASLNNASLFLSYTVVTAPFDGWVARKTVQPGQLVKEGQNLVNVVSQEKWVTANFKETQIAPLKVGSHVKIEVDAYPDKEYEGVVASFSPASGSSLSLIPQDNSTGNFVKIEQRIPVRIHFNDGQDISMLRVGMNVVVHATKN
jgi:membrane fusion protein (multidrug efflux system)